MECIDSVKRRLITADIIKEEDIESDRVILGSTIYMEDIDTGGKSKLSLVVEDRVDPMNDRISVNSPIARGFIGKKVGEEVKIEIPAGIKNYKIIRIERNI
ncbi:MAG: GreA/GreB family elongation factor [Elusimicrobiota bacterium]|nr:GreA/GreB family elongation factor [Elusimicrobiota bacterium]